jgi:hypothetical protein
MESEYNKNFINALKTISSSSDVASTEECLAILDNKELFALFALDTNLSPKSRNFVENTGWKLIGEFPQNIENDILIHSVFSLNNDIETTSQLFAYFLNMYMHSDKKYNEYLSYKCHNVEHLTIIKACKRLHKCLLLLYKICKSDMDNEFIAEYIKTVCSFDGDFDHRSMVKKILHVILVELNTISMYDFNIYVGNHITDIFGHIIDELIDCGNDLKPYKFELKNFLLSHRDKFSKSLGEIDLDNHPDHDTWSHKYITSL